MLINLDPIRFKELRETHGFYTAKKMALREKILEHLEDARRLNDVNMVCDVIETMLRESEII